MTAIFEPWEDALIVERYQAEGPKNLALKMPGKTKQAILHRARVLGATAARARDWSPREDGILRRCHPDWAKAERLLVDRSRYAIYSRARTLELGHHKPWRPTEKELFRKVAQTLSDSEIGVMLGRTAKAVQTRRLKHSEVRRPGDKGPTVPVIRDVHDMAAARGVVVSKLTSALGCGRINRTITRRKMSISAVAAIVEVLGGELYAEWAD